MAIEAIILESEEARRMVEEGMGEPSEGPARDRVAFRISHRKALEKEGRKGRERGKEGRGTHDSTP